MEEITQNNSGNQRKTHNHKSRTIDIINDKHFSELQVKLAKLIAEEAEKLMHDNPKHNFSSAVASAFRSMCRNVEVIALSILATGISSENAHK